MCLTVLFWFYFDHSTLLIMQNLSASARGNFGQLSGKEFEGRVFESSREGSRGLWKGSVP